MAQYPTHISTIDMTPSSSDASLSQTLAGFVCGLKARDLPAAAVKYIRRLEELIEVPVALLSTSPERDDTILVRDPFAD